MRKYRFAASFGKDEISGCTNSALFDSNIKNMFDRAYILPVMMSTCPHRQYMAQAAFMFTFLFFG